MKNYYRVRKGFVFWYNLNERVNKNNPPKVVVNGKEYPDRRQYGMRMWLVVSCDACNGSSSVVTIVPITTQVSKAPLPTHVSVNYEGKPLTVLCEQPMSVNMVELKDFICVLGDDVMEKVDKALKVHLGIKDDCMYKGGEVGQALSRIEEVIDNVIREKISSTYKARQVDVDNYVLRVAEGLENLIGTSDNEGNNKEDGDTKKPEEVPTVKESISAKSSENVKEVVAEDKNSTSSSNNVVKNPNKTITSEMSAIEKFNKRYPGVCNTLNKEVSKEPVKKSGKKKWPVEKMKEFLNDCESMSTTQIMEKWDMKSPKTVFQYKYIFKNKLGGINEK